MVVLVVLSVSVFFFGTSGVAFSARKEVDLTQINFVVLSYHFVRIMFVTIGAGVLVIGSHMANGAI